MAEIKSIEALKNLRLFMKLEDKDNDVKFPYETYEAVDMAIKALEMQIPKKPITYKDTNRADCPCCGATVRGIKNLFGDWCSNCGQKLDWSE